MVSYKIIVSDNQNVVHIKTKKKDKIDFDFIISGYKNPLFLKPEYSFRENIVFNPVLGESLYELLQNTIKKRDFLIIIESIIVVLESLLDCGHSLNRIVLDLKAIFYDRNKQQVFFVVLPFENERNRTDIYKFFLTFLENCRPAIENNTDYIERFKGLVKQIQGFDLNRFESFISLEDRQVIDLVRGKLKFQENGFSEQENLGAGSKSEAIKNGSAKKVFEQKKTDKSVAGELYEDDKATEFARENPTQFAGEEKTLFAGEAETRFAIETETQLASTEHSEENSTVLAHTFVPHDYSLIRYSTGESIKIDKLVFRLGRIKECVDYCINDESVSRVHLDIICRNDDVFVRDLGSKNKSFLNGTVLQKNVEIRINDGDVICIANEKFIFCKG